MLRHSLIHLQATLAAMLRVTPLARVACLNLLNAEIALRLHGAKHARVGPFLIEFDPRDRVLAKSLVLHGTYERFETAIFLAELRPGDIALDIGANIGYYTLHTARAVGPAGRVVAIEPDPSNLALLRANLTRNDCRNADVVPCALGAEEGTVALRQHSSNRGRLAFARGRHDHPTVSVPLRRGATVLAELGVRPRVAKIDVEGAEPEVLAGLGDLPEVIMLEFMPSMLQGQGHDPVRFLRWLTKQGFGLELIDPGTGARMPGGPEAIVARTEAFGREVNLLARRA